MAEIENGINLTENGDGGRAWEGLRRGPGIIDFHFTEEYGMKRTRAIAAATGLTPAAIIQKEAIK